MSENGTSCLAASSEKGAHLPPPPPPSFPAPSHTQHTRLTLSCALLCLSLTLLLLLLLLLLNVSHTFCNAHIRASSFCDVNQPSKDIIIGQPAVNALILMGRTKKKLPVAPSKQTTVAAAEPGAPAPVQRKRGRPRKVVKEEAAVEDADTKADDAGSKGKKLPKLAADTAPGSQGRNRSRPGKKDADLLSPKSECDKLLLESSNSGNHLDEVVKVNASHRVGRRRKSEPRRAAGTFPEGS